MATRKIKATERATTTLKSRRRTPSAAAAGRRTATQRPLTLSEIARLKRLGKQREYRQALREYKLAEMRRRLSAASRRVVDRAPARVPTSRRELFRFSLSESMDLLRGRGLEITVDELDQLVAAAVSSLAKTVAATGLSEAEHDTLARGGFARMSHPAGTDDPLAKTVAEFTAIRLASKSVADVAVLLGVNESRIRQRLGERPRSLYGFKLEGAWRIPNFLLDGERLVPGVEKIAARLSTELHPVAVYRWFTTPHPDLVDESGVASEGARERPLAPRSWLLAGHDPEPVARLAEEL